MLRSAFRSLEAQQSSSVCRLVTQYGFRPFPRSPQMFSVYRQLHLSSFDTAPAAAAAMKKRQQDCASSAGRKGGGREERDREGLVFFPTKAHLIEAKPPPSSAWAAKSLPKIQKGVRKAVSSYTFFEDFESFFLFLQNAYDQQRPLPFFEVFPEDKPRCLYFDLDSSDASFKGREMQHVKELTDMVRHFFCVDDAEILEPNVLIANRPDKYSCHVRFPQISFANQRHQNDVLRLFLDTLYSGGKTNILTDGDPELASASEKSGAMRAKAFTDRGRPEVNAVIDRAPYTSFQLLRAPFACKLRDGQPAEDSTLVPYTWPPWKNDERTFFASFVEPLYASPSATTDIEEICARREDVRTVRELHQRSRGGTAALWGFVKRPGSGAGGGGDSLNLFSPQFVKGKGLERKGEREGEKASSKRNKKSSPGAMDDLEDVSGTSERVVLAGLSDVAIFRTLLNDLHPSRASDWYSWFRVCGICWTLLESGKASEEATADTWEAFFAWSKQYTDFDEAENIKMVEKNEGRPFAWAQGRRTLLQMAEHDNPGKAYILLDDANKTIHSLYAAQTHSSIGEAWGHWGGEVVSSFSSSLGVSGGQRRGGMGAGRVGRGGVGGQMNNMRLEVAADSFGENAGVVLDHRA
uniref:Uncharacterized protein n=1 Tax=Chromera velia CCMP2878 TaxID=1169474 RepID=A0A0G4HMM6_9ALVE|eukprot:Cvel_7585.t1-p1 / transcript=Cvel_7585.t1 / gene=Cvel_7585 / organism=Chromera_velia_CCMP2878 / gene_product=hypothetical protein / transcript_product=hypothetical protein / location=Cvel_scaffold399:54148-61195(+) / protein_length=635 / sequence_SO=supercontig / SO=protein_coding / is_pseudo=false